MIVMVIIGFTRWTGIARYLRGELLKVRSLEYVEAAACIGISRVADYLAPYTAQLSYLSLNLSILWRSFRYST
jgi:ABC-type dipeptide/oligopeptide/nickel transport system permease subunit